MNSEMKSEEIMQNLFFRFLETTPVRRIILWVLWLIIILTLVSVVVWSFDFIRFSEFTVGQYVRVFSMLFLVALFMERALEVFLTAWRGEGATEILRGIEKLKAISAHREVNEDEIERVEDARRTYEVYRVKTQRIAFLGSLALGIVISAAGIRALASLVDPEMLGDVEPVQRRLFGLMDVILTGALLGGGTEAIHQLVSVFSNTMAKIAQQAKGIQG